MTIEILQPFSLVGGTALALRYGHRGSIDLDLFTHLKFDQFQIILELEKEFHDQFVFVREHSILSVFCFINNIKVDLIHYPHLPISGIETIEGIRLYNDADIAAMKIQAILGRAKKKDFWDLFELLKHYSLQQIADWHKQKYPSQMLAISIPHAVTYFVDAEETEEPVSFKNQTWEEVKKGIRDVVSGFLK